MKFSQYTAVAALLAAATLATAADEPAMSEKPFLYVSQSANITALVEAINHETREVTLRGPQGNAVSFVASDEARNLGQVSVGDIVSAEYVESLSIEVMANEGLEPDAGELSAMARTEKGEMPGFAVMDAQVVTATVEEINLEANTFKLKGPDGEINEYVARNPENLRRADVGDLVVITVTEAIAISVEVGPGG
jgi:hypothetical protein